MKSVQLDWCVYGMTEAQDGDAKKLCSPQIYLGMSEANNLKNRIEEKLGWSRKSCQWVTGKQIHGTSIQIVNKKSSAYFPETDGFLSDIPNLFLTVFVADCVPVILWENRRKVVGILHAGWRGTANGILKEAFALLQKNWQIKPFELNFFLGAHIRSCCYNVGKEVAMQFPEESLLQKNEKIFLSLENALKHQVQSLGGRSKQISADPSCTFCNPNFFSFRRDKTEARMLAFIAKWEN